MPAAPQCFSRVDRSCVRWAGAHRPAHPHSSASDGTDPPAEVMRRARERGVDLVALTDHDTVAGHAGARAALSPGPPGLPGLTFVPGMELSCHLYGQSLHLLAYLFDPAHPGLARLRDGSGSSGKRHGRVQRHEGLRGSEGASATTSLTGSPSRKPATTGKNLPACRTGKPAASNAITHRSQSPRLPPVREQAHLHGIAARMPLFSPPVPGIPRSRHARPFKPGLILSASIRPEPLTSRHPHAPAHGRGEPGGHPLQGLPQ